MTTMVFGFPGHDELAATLIGRLGGSRGELELRRFPDGECYVRLATPVAGRTVVLACGLHRADERLLPLVFAAAAAKELGAASVGIVAPYLGYLRQDKRFQPGEAVTSATFAKIVSGFADWLVTVDPHLHRYRALGEIYSMRTAIVHAAAALSAWIRAQVGVPLLVGPDAESEQWVAEVARGADAPYVVMEKNRRGDRDVEVTAPGIEAHGGRTPVLVDDIISTAGTMIAAVRHLRRLGMPAPVCIGVHAIFADDAYAELKAAGAARVVTCNTIAHASNAIDLNGAIADRVAELAR
ncbi:MAG: ribose-phosphate pyrophosphokinase [Burkholderiales bacterium]